MATQNHREGYHDVLSTHKIQGWPWGGNRFPQKKLMVIIEGILFEMDGLDAQ